MTTAFSVIRPSTAAAVVFQSSAIPQFISFIGVPSCANGVAATVNLPNETASALAILSQGISTAVTSITSSGSGSVTTTASEAVTITPLPPAANLAPKDDSGRLPKKDIIAIGVVISGVTILIVLLGMAQWRNRRRHKHTAQTEGDLAESSEDAQPYLQQKAELEAEERRQLELDAQDLQFEMEGTQARHEIGGTDNQNELSAESVQGNGSGGLLHELRGEEHLKELDGSMIQ